MRTKLLLALLAALALVLPLAPAQAITNGVADNGAHPYVGEVLLYLPDESDPRFTDPGAWGSCSATLLDPTHVVTAGHCTFGTGTNGAHTPGGSGGNDTWVSFEEAPDFSILPRSVTFAPGNNAGRYAAWSAALNASPTWHRGTAYPHPQYDDAAFPLHDMGVIVLDEPVNMSTYGKVPSLGLIDQLYAADKNATYTAVGYGLEGAGPRGDVGGDTRRDATVQLVNTNGVYGLGSGIQVAWSANKGVPHRGGTCFGDSGGPTFPADQVTVLTVTSFGIDSNCAAGGGGYRLDEPDDLAFLATFGLTP